MFRFFIPTIALMAVACNSIRPETRTGPVIDDSRLVSVAFHFRSSDSDAPPDTLLVRHFHYFVRPASWSVVSSGENRPATVFEEVGVYALTTLGLTRLTRLPQYHLDGITPARVHIAPRPSGPIPFSLESEPRFLVYVEGGPVYGGIGLDGTLDPQTTPERDLKLLVDRPVYRADLGLDGETIIFVDQARRVFTVPKGQTAATAIADLSNRLGASVVKGIRWNGPFFDSALLLVDRGLNEGGEAVYRLDAATGGFGIVGGDPAVATNVTSPATLALVENRVKSFDYSDWKVPDPDVFK